MRCTVVPALLALLALIRLACSTEPAVVVIRVRALTAAKSFRLAIGADATVSVLVDSIAARLAVPTTSLAIWDSDGLSELQPPFRNHQLVIAAPIADDTQQNHLAWENNARGVDAYVGSTKLPHCDYRTLKLESHRLEGRNPKYVHKPRALAT